MDKADDKKIVEAKVEYKAEDFAKEYQALCDKTGFRILAVPTWIARDDGTFSTQLQYQVGQLPKQ